MGLRIAVWLHKTEYTNFGTRIALVVFHEALRISKLLFAIVCKIAGGKLENEKYTK
jgi:hypothetical protein